GNFLENIPRVQFNHRLLGIASLFGMGVLWVASWKTTLSRRACTALGLLFGVAILQVGLGIATLLLVVPLPFGVAHQAGAVLLFTCALWVGYETHGETSSKPHA
ncbi:MAG: COX15/CtaA family protein, partial [Alphaproteobacteria bacterium]|nr:COX15/CtaA family protein [Alphaproteobacteria bacterium]